jgi:hypothetical protein
VRILNTTDIIGLLVGSIIIIGWGILDYRTGKKKYKKK